MTVYLLIAAVVSGFQLASARISAEFRSIFTRFYWFFIGIFRSDEREKMIPSHAISAALNGLARLAAATDTAANQQPANEKPR